MKVGSPLPEIRVISFKRYFMPAVFRITYRACSLVSDCRNNMAASGRCKERVDYIALNNLSSADLETVSTRKRKYKPGAKLYQVERLISKRKSATEVCINSVTLFIIILFNYESLSN